MDKFKAMLLEGYLKNKFGKYIDGGALSVELDIESGKCALNVKLVGEESPVEVRIGSFSVVLEGGEKRLRIDEISASRRWLDMALNDALKGKPLKLPSLVASAL